MDGDVGVDDRKCELVRSKKEEVDSFMCKVGAKLRVM